MNGHDLDVIKSEIAYKIYNSSVNRYPFAHSETDNFLPIGLLEEILENWPQSDEFITNLESGSISGVHQSDEEHPYNFRYQICLTDSKEISKIKDERIDFWKSLTTNLADLEKKMDFLLNFFHYDCNLNYFYLSHKMSKDPYIFENIQNLGPFFQSLFQK